MSNIHTGSYINTVGFFCFGVDEACPVEYHFFHQIGE
jgi:hypothetical protein